MLFLRIRLKVLNLWNLNDIYFCGNTIVDN